MVVGRVHGCQHARVLLLVLIILLLLHGGEGGPDSLFLDRSRVVYHRVYFEIEGLQIWFDLCRGRGGLVVLRWLHGGQHTRVLPRMLLLLLRLLTDIGLTCDVAAGGWW